MPKFSYKNFSYNKLNNLDILFAIKSKLNSSFSILRFIRLFYSLKLVHSETLFINLTYHKFTSKDLLLNLVSLIPVFGLYFNSINKFIKKYSRGKSGKFNIKLKYLPPYKRFKYLLSILSKDFFFNTKNTLKKKLTISLKSIIYKNISSFTLKFRLMLYYLLNKQDKLPIYREKLI